MGSKRRYTPIRDKEKAYHNEFDRLRVSSIVLNSDARIRSDRAIDFNRRSDLKRLLTEYRETLDRVHTVTVDGVDTMVKVQHDVGRMNTGKPARKKAPHGEATLLEEAHEDVLLEECEELDKLINDIGVPNPLGPALLHGPRGHSIIKAGRIVSADGQAVKLDEAAGVYRLSDKRSPWNGLSTVSYFSDVVGPWNTARRKIQNARLTLARKWREKGTPEEFEAEWKLVRAAMFKSHPAWKDLFSHKGWPDPKMIKRNESKK